MNLGERRAIETECQRLLQAYCVHLDRRDFDAFANVFTPQARLTYPYADLHGHGEIRAWLEARPATVLTIHQSSTPLIEVAGPARATGISTVTVYRHEAASLPLPRPLTFGGPVQVGQYEDEFELTASGWRIARRLVSVLLNVPVVRPGG